MNLYRHERDKLEKHFSQLVNKEIESISGNVSKKDVDKLRNITDEAFTLSKENTTQWIKLLENSQVEKKPGFFYRSFWKKFNKTDKINI